MWYIRYLERGSKKCPCQKCALCCIRGWDMATFKSNYLDRKLSNFALGPNGTAKAKLDGFVSGDDWI